MSDTITVSIDTDQARRLLFAKGWTRLSPSGQWVSPDGTQRLCQTDEALTVMLEADKTVGALAVGAGN